MIRVSITNQCVQDSVGGDAAKRVKALVSCIAAAAATAPEVHNALGALNPVMAWRMLRWDYAAMPYVTLHPLFNISD